MTCELNSATTPTPLCWTLVDIAALENGLLLLLQPVVDGFVSPAAVADATDDGASAAALLGGGPAVAMAGGAAMRWRTGAEHCGPGRAGHEGPAVVGAGLGPPAGTGAPPVIHG